MGVTTWVKGLFGKDNLEERPIPSHPAQTKVNAERVESDNPIDTYLAKIKPFLHNPRSLLVQGIPEDLLQDVIGKVQEENSYPLVQFTDLLQVHGEDTENFTTNALLQYQGKTVLVQGCFDEKGEHKRLHTKRVYLAMRKAAENLGIKFFMFEDHESPISKEAIGMHHPMSNWNKFVDVGK
jgi:hypothetical protein